MNEGSGTYRRAQSEIGEKGMQPAKVQFHPSARTVSNLGKLAEQIEHPLFVAGESISQQITRLLGTDDWAILHSGHELVTDVDLDRIEARDGRVK